MGETVTVVGGGDYYSRCPTCDNDPERETVEYRSEEPQDVKREARDHREWHPDHRPYARGPDGERIYG